MLKKRIAAFLTALLVLMASALAEMPNGLSDESEMAEAAESDWYMAVLADPELSVQFPYHSFLDINGDGVPVLIVSTTEDAFIGAEDGGNVFLYKDGESVLAMTFGGAGGEKFFCNADSHTLTHYSRLSGEEHIEVYEEKDGALALVTTADHYAPYHGPAENADADTFFQDEQAISPEAGEALFAQYTNDSDVVTYAPMSVANSKEDSFRFGASEQADENVAYAFAGSWQDEVSQRASMDVTQDGRHVEILVHWGGSATEAASWEISGEYDPETGALTYKDARYTVTEWDEDGNDTIIEEKTADGAFTWEDDKLRWTDSLNESEGLFVKLDDGYDFEAPEPAEAPTAEEFAERYFNVLVNLESGTAGASLKTADTASDVCAFAIAHDLYNPDVESLRENMLIAFEGLGEDEQAAFWTGFDTVRALLDDCLEDYDANRVLFEDAGVVDAMDEVMYDPLNRLAWENLRDHTLTMGNDTNVG